MIVSLVIVTYSTGGVIFSRFYGHDLRTEMQQAEWLKKLRDATAPDWPLLTEDNAQQVATIAEVQLLYALLGDVVLIFAGTDEHDALLMAELANNMIRVLRSVCSITENRRGDTRVSAERKILQSYANLCLAVDEMIDDGDIDHLEPRVVTRMVRMRPTR